MSSTTKKRWDGKVITTSKQWLFNDDGSIEIGTYSMQDIFDSAYEAYQNDNYYVN